MYQRLTIVFMLITLTLTGVSCTRGGDPAARQAFQPVNLEYWTVFNSPDDYEQIIADYRAIHPNIRINVKKFRFDEYEEELLNALAEDRGPDIFSVHHTWLPSYRTKLLPLPPVTTLPYQYETGTVRKETVTEFRSTGSLNEFDLRSQFLEQVYNDVYLPEVTLNEEGEIQFGDPIIYALPIGFDSMVLYYNRDLLDNAGIAQPAKSWEEMQQHVSRLVRFSSDEDILVAGAALGTADNIPRSVDILSMLMMQNGAQMITENGEVNFHRIPDELRGQREIPPGEEATRFYTSFANPNRRLYTWNQEQPDAFEAFLQGQVGYFFGYAYHLPQIEGLAPKLNFGIANAPQIQGNPIVHYANYWAESVSRKTQNPDAAWDFIQFMTSAEEARKFLESARKPTARRDLIDPQLEDPEMFVFASQLLTSRAWYNGIDSGAMEGIMRDLIKDALAEELELRDLMELAAQRVQQTLR